MTFLMILLVLALWVAPILVARQLGRAFDMPKAWLWGLFLGWLGVFIVAARVPGKTRRAMKDAGLHTSLSGTTRDAAALKQRLLGELEGGKKCPTCAETVQGEAKVCRYCGHQFQTVEAPAELA